VDLWDIYDVEIQVRTRIVGGIPKSPDLIRAWLESRAPAKVPAAVANGGAPHLEKLIAQVQAEMADQAPEGDSAIERSWTGFKRTRDGRPAIESRNVKASFREGSNVCKEIIGIRNMKSKCSERVFVDPPRIALEGAPDPLPWEDRAVHVMTAQGPRTALKRFDYVEQPTLRFWLRVLKDGLFTEEILRTLREYGQENGLGAARSQDEGKYDLVSFTRRAA
jgi:hypothetical protein